MDKEARKTEKAALRLAAADLKARLTRPTTPDEFIAICDAAHDEHGHLLITTPQTGFYREAWLAGHYANRRGADLVWLGKDPPDFEIQIGADRFSYEVVEVVRPGRERNIELDMVYEQGPQHDPESNWLTVDQIAKLVEDKVRDKSDDRYLNVSGLLVYANTGWVAGHSKISVAFELLIHQLRIRDWSFSPFGEIWVAKSEYCDWIKLPIIV